MCATQQETEAKRARHERKAYEEQKQRELKEHEIDEKQKQLQKLKDEYHLLKEKLRRSMPLFVYIGIVAALAQAGHFIVSMCMLYCLVGDR